MSKMEMMARDKKKGALVPRLRFPEFRDAGKWEMRYGNDLFDNIINKNQNFDLPILAITQEYGAIPRSTIEYNVSVTEKSIENYKIVNIGDFIISLRSFQGGIEYSHFCGLCSPAYIILRKKVILNDVFFKFFFKSEHLISRLNVNIEGLRDGKMITYKQFSEVLLPFPSPAEQQRIADCLSSLEERIAAETNKLDALKDHKKGLLKQLFPAEGETLPQLRFPEFRDAGEWGQAPLGELLLSQPDYGLNAPAVPYTSSLPTYIRITDISEEGQFIAEKKVSVDVVAVPENCLHPGDIVLARTGASVGKAYKYNENDGILVFAGFLIRVKPNWKKINSNFLFNFLFTKRYWDWVVLTSPRSGQPGINSSEYATLPVPTPPSDGDMQCEQQRIADCLSSLDELIAAQTQKINLLKDHKKGLMQQLFPCIDEVRA